MSVYRHKGSPYYHFDIQVGGHRLHGSTKQTNRRLAEGFVEDQRRALKQRQREASEHELGENGGPRVVCGGGLEGFESHRGKALLGGNVGGHRSEAGV